MAPISNRMGYPCVINNGLITWDWLPSQTFINVYSHCEFEMSVFGTFYR